MDKELNTPLNKEDRVDGTKSTRDGTKDQKDRGFIDLEDSMLNLEVRSTLGGKQVLFLNIYTFLLKFL